MKHRATTVKGYLFGGIASGVKKDRRKKDLGLIVSEVPARITALFTQNRFAAAPILLGRKMIRRGWCRAVIVNSGNANACTGKRGIRDAQAMASLVASELGVEEEEVLVSSTGVIGESLPMHLIRSGIPKVVRSLSPFGIGRFAEAILTTDKFRKVVSDEIRVGKGRVRLCGIAKGAGMIQPNMATMLAYVVTDALLDPPFMRSVFRRSCEVSFNAITIDGEESTNDTAVLLANGLADNNRIERGSRNSHRFEASLCAIMKELARLIVQDAEGGTKVVRIRVEGAPSIASARKIAYRIANSLLVKTALYGEDLNWGRIVAAIGSTKVPVDPHKVALAVGGTPVLRDGQPLCSQQEKIASQHLKRSNIEIVVDLKKGGGTAEVLTSDLTPEYIHINSRYRS